MATLNLLTCDTASGNTGIGKCVRMLQAAVGGFFIPKGTGISAADAVNLKTFIAGKVHAAVYAERWHPVGNWNTITAQDQEEVTQTFEDGSSYTNRDGYYSAMYRHLNGQCFHQSLRRFEGRQEQYDYLEVDKDGRLVGVAGYNAAGLEMLYGFDLSRIHIPNLTRATQAEAVGYWLTLDLADATEMNDRVMMMDAKDVQGIKFNPLAYAKSQSVKDVFLSNLTPSGAASGVFTIFVAEGCNDVSIGKTYGAALTAANVVAKNKTTGAPITVTSFVVQATDAAPYILTLDTTDPDYPATGYIELTLTGVTSLFTALGNYYEANTITFLRS